MKAKYISFLAVLTTFLCSCKGPVSKEKLIFESDWLGRNNAVFVGEDYWANRLQDWRINNGRLECIDGRLQLRTLQLLTTSLDKKLVDLSMEVDAGNISNENKADDNAFCGFILGCGRDIDYRARALIHNGSGKNGGVIACVNKKGELLFLDNEDSLNVLARSNTPVSDISTYHLKFEGKVVNEKYSLKLFLINDKGDQINECSLENYAVEKLYGGVALVANKGASVTGESYWFNNLKLYGDKFNKDESKAFGPIVGVQYTVNGNTLKLSAQFFPLGVDDTHNATLEIKEKKTGRHLFSQTAPIEDLAHIALFRINNWDPTKDNLFIVKYSMFDKQKRPREYTYEGKIDHEPTEKDEMVIATLDCNNNCSSTFNTIYDFDSTNLWFPHKDLLDNIKIQNPDLLINMGDQLYESRPTDADKSGSSSSYLDYLYKWYLWYWAYGDLTRNIPSVCLVDDHDVFQGNLWGAGGVKAREYLKNENDYPDQYKKECIDCWAPDGGGYTMPADFVKMVERTQTAHLPDAYDTTTLPYGIKPYYTSLKYGGVSFALLEDRKFKSAPSVMLPWAKVVNGFSQLEKYNAKEFDVKNAELFGKKQEEFIGNWAQDWDDVSVKIAVSQTELANIATMPSTYKTDDSLQFIGIYKEDSIPKGYDFAKDMDSDGWPQHARNIALEEFRKGFAFHLGGDQHLGILLQHGVDSWQDAGYSFCVPPVANAWPRRWFPPYEGKNRDNGSPYYTGDYEDGFGNKITIHAAASPHITAHHPAMLYDLVAGYGILKVNTKKQQIKIECWPRYAAPGKVNDKQFHGWPLTINVEDNYTANAPYCIAKLKFEDNDPNVLIQVIEEATNEIVYTIKTFKKEFFCNVFKKGIYKMIITNLNSGKKIARLGLNAEEKNRAITIEPVF